MGKSYGEIFHEMVTMPNVQWPEVWQAILETLYMTVVSTLFEIGRASCRERVFRAV